MNADKLMQMMDERAGAVMEKEFPVMLEKFAAWIFPDGKIASVSADGRFCDLWLNNADVITGDPANSKTFGVPIAPHVIKNDTLAPNDEVIVLRRSARALMVMSKKQIG